MSFDLMEEPQPAPTPVKGARYQLSRVFMLVGLGVLVLSCSFAYKGREPFSTWLFNFAWWSYILIVDGWVYRNRGESLIISYPGRFVFLAVWSTALWFIFEAFNLRLQNWSYVELPSSPALRWLGYFLAFGTVVPGLLETADLIESAGFIKEGRAKPLGWKKRVEPAFVGLGIAMLILPLLWPRFFFPLVWGGFIFLLEPLNERWGAPSLLSDWRTGRLHRFYLLLIAGFFCGGLWEWWNSWSRARWTYSVPWGGGWKIFEMPALGYLGFPPFAVEVFVMTVFALTVWKKSSPLAKWALFSALLLFSLFMCGTVDRFTVKSFQSASVAAGAG